METTFDDFNTPGGIDAGSTARFVPRSASRFLTRGIAVVRRYRLYRDTVIQLHSCSDRVLQDLGIDRDKISERARMAIDSVGPKS